MVKAWQIELGGAGRRLEVEWDTLGTGAGRIVVDGVEVGRWGFGVKWPGVERSATAHGHTLTVVQRLRDFELLVDGRAPAGARAVAPSLKERRTAIWLALGIVALGLVIAAIASFLRR